MPERTFYPNNFRLIFFENLIPVFAAMAVAWVLGYLPRPFITLAVYYYVLAYIHYVILQPLKIGPHTIEGPAASLMWRRKIPRQQLEISSEQVLSFRILKIRDQGSGRSIVFFTNYYKPETVREIESRIFPGQVM